MKYKIKVQCLSIPQLRQFVETLEILQKYKYFNVTSSPIMDSFKTQLIGTVGVCEINKIYTVL